ncbi:hypothetical protein [Pseudoscardovia suis]|uniref:Prolipoprotein diacylglyceryl transferase n=1 Tax=Pseudoscardovia suis TaxID=987063 RepID=A0A261ERS0_9BIFI|nr:hypothetical protein [Pseudoscardovia suis]OZG49552.1 prolipoprotein diacylglyceryl transferase [Pseudoscardovia suis]PJJ69671.1 hypothetical protein CLV65_0380 [Pseudoscardovia suis]
MTEGNPQPSFIPNNPAGMENPANAAAQTAPQAVPQTAPVMPQAAPATPMAAPVMPQAAPVTPTMPQTAPVMPMAAPTTPQAAPTMPMAAPTTPQAAPNMPMAVPQQPVAAKKPMGAKTKIFILLIAVIVIVAITSAVTIARVSESKKDPRTIVENYMNALADGNYGIAADIADPGLTDAQRVLLQDGIIPDVSKRISSVKVGDPKQLSSTEYSLPVSYTVNGNTSSDVSVIVKKSGKFLNTTWSFEKSLLGVIIVSSTSYATVSINGKTPTADSNYTNTGISTPDSFYSLGSDDSSSLDSDDSDNGLASASKTDLIAVPAYPGDYDVTAQSPSKYMDATIVDSHSLMSTTQKSSYTVPAQSGVILGVSVTASDALATEITNQLKDHQKKCVDNANAGGADDNSCYINASYITKKYSDPDFADWKYTFKSAEVADQPNIDASELLMPTTENGKTTFEVSDNGSVKVNYTEQYEDSTPYDESTTVYGGGSYWSGGMVKATIDGDTVSLDYQDIYTTLFD